MGVRQRLILRLGHERWAATLIRRFGSRFDRFLFRVSGGRPSVVGEHVLLLTTTGRRSGQPRTTPVIYIRDGDDFVVSSEDFGQERPAGWPLNLDAHPEATVTLGRTAVPCRARRLEEAEADRYWERLVEIWPAHATYRERSGKRHMFLLQPVDR